MRIMVADQDTEHRHQLAELGQKWGHELQEVLSGREVVDLCRKKCPDLILVDFMLSGQSGLDIVRQIRQTGGHAIWVPIVIMAKSFTKTEIVQCVEAGADDILLKPVPEAEFMLKVHSAARQVNLKDEVFKVAHELVVVNRALQNVVTQDVLTGVHNSNSFDETLEREWFAAKKLKAALSLILINVDFFQRYNQAYDAKAGDEVIKRVAEALKAAMPTGSGFLARTIGDTFAILLPNMTGADAYKLGEKLNKSIDALNIPHKDSGCSDHVTTSFGVASVEQDQFTKPWDLKDAADYGLFKAKHAGRNRGFLVSATEVVK